MESQDLSGNTVLSEVAAGSQAHAIQLLAKQGASPNSKVDAGPGPGLGAPARRPLRPPVLFRSPSRRAPSAGPHCTEQPSGGTWRPWRC